jgi:hypothetical protein
MFKTKGEKKAFRCGIGFATTKKSKKTKQQNQKKHTNKSFRDGYEDGAVKMFNSKKFENDANYKKGVLAGWGAAKGYDC